MLQTSSLDPGSIEISANSFGAETETDWLLIGALILATLVLAIMSAAKIRGKDRAKAVGKS